MKIKQTILALALLIGLSGIFIIPNASAASCGGVETSLLDCGAAQDGSGVCLNGQIITKEDLAKDVKCTDRSTPDVISKSGLWGILLTAINILTAGIGIAAVGGIVYGSILYTSAGGDAANVKKAKDIIVNVVIGLVAYAVMYSFLNYIIPGGLFT